MIIKYTRLKNLNNDSSSFNQLKYLGVKQQSHRILKNLQTALVNML